MVATMNTRFFSVVLIAAFTVSCSGKPSSTATESTTAAPLASPVEEAKTPAETLTKTDKVPDRYAVQLDTTKGPIIIDVHRNWAPKGADRFYELITKNYFTDIAFFRVISGFMAQIGIHGDPETNGQWREKRIADDPVIGSNTRGTVSFATSGPNSRTTQFFINFSNNGRLDTMGFAPFGKVRNMDNVDRLYSGYGEGAPGGRGPSQALMSQRGNDYLRAQFPQLDYIKKAMLTDPKP